MKIITWVITAISVVLAGCGGAGEVVNQTSDGYTVESGLAQKGPLVRGSGVTLNELNAVNLQPNGKSYTFEVKDDSGKFSPAGITFSSALIESTALGYYYDESKASKSTSMVYLRGLSNLAINADKAVNVNLLTSFTKDRIKKLVTATPPMGFALARAQAERELLAAFFIYNRADIFNGLKFNNVIESANFMELNLGAARTSDQILSAISGLVTAMQTSGADLNYFINQVETDLADDGLLNNSPGFTTAVLQQLLDASRTANMQSIASNLNEFYKTNYKSTDLSQWLDSSGGVDKVIDKYKFSATNVPVGWVSKSPAYITGVEDIGQCFSVGSLTGASGGLYVGTTMAASTVYKVTAKGTSLYLGLSASAAGAASGFIQRFTPTSTTCPSTIPTGITAVRVQKYSITAIVVNPLEISSLQNFWPSTSFALLANGNWAMAHRRSNALMTLSVLDGAPGNFGRILWSIDSNQGFSMDYIYFHHDLSVDANQKILWPNGCEISSVSTSGIVAWKYTDETCSSSSSPLYFAALPLADGDVLAINQANITKLNSKGVVRYKKQISNSAPINAPVWMADAVMAKDGNVLVIAGTQGMSECVSAGNANCYFLMKIRVSDGSILWRKPILTSGFNSSFTIRLVKLSNDNLYVAGNGTSLITKKDSYWLLKMNEDGVIAAEYDLAASSKFVTVQTETVIPILSTDGSNLYAIAGCSYYCVPRALKITQSGQISWFSDLPNTEWYGIANAIAADRYGGILVGGINQPAPDTFGWLRYYFP